MNSAIFSGGFTSTLKKVGDDIPFSSWFYKGHTLILIILKKNQRNSWSRSFFLGGGGGGTNKYFFKNILLDSCDILRLKIV